jgi:hypothetical protein
MEEDFSGLFVSADSQIGRIELENSEAVHQNPLNRDYTWEILAFGFGAQLAKLQQLMVKLLDGKDFFQQTQWKHDQSIVFGLQ